MVIYDSESMGGFRGLALWQAGADLACPVCGAMLSVIPEGISRSQTPLGLFCPQNKAHVFFYGETAAAFESVRQVIKRMPRREPSPCSQYSEGGDKGSVSVQAELKSALLHFLQAGDLFDLSRLLRTHSDVVSVGRGEYPDLHRLLDLRVEGRNFRVFRQISKGEFIGLEPIELIFSDPGVPLWLTGEKLLLWAAEERENPSKEPVDWSKYR